MDSPRLDVLTPLNLTTPLAVRAQDPHLIRIPQRWRDSTNHSPESCVNTCVTQPQMWLVMSLQIRIVQVCFRREYSSYGDGCVFLLWSTDNVLIKIFWIVWMHMHLISHFMHILHKASSDWLTEFTPTHTNMHAETHLYKGQCKHNLKYNVFFLRRW